MDTKFGIDASFSQVIIHLCPGHGKRENMAHLYYERAHWCKKYHVAVILLFCLSGFYTLYELLTNDLEKIAMGMAKEKDNKRPALIYGTNLLSVPPTPCDEQSDKLLILITSKPDNRDVRNIIRTTWLKQVREHNLPVHHVFLVGHAPTWSLKQLQEEHTHHGDLAVFDFHDTYRNLTRKTLLGLDWAWQRCSQVQYIMKADDDSYVNIINVLNILKREVPSRPYMIGSVRTMRAPNRVKGQKYYVSEAEYSPQFYPSYCDGASYIMPTRIAQDVVRVTKEGLIRPVLTLEDVHVGRCVGQLGYGLRHRNALNVDKKFALNHPQFLCSSSVASVHPVTMEELKGIWNTCTRRDHSSEQQKV